MQQYCSVCSYEFKIPISNEDQIKVIGKYSSEDTCERCLKDIKIRLDNFKLIEPVASVSKFPVMIWRFEDAPKIYQDMSNNGGDEDWVALVPPSFNSDYTPMWLENLDTCRDPQVYEIANGYKIIIGAHA